MLRCLSSLSDRPNGNVRENPYNPYSFPEAPISVWDWGLWVQCEFYSPARTSAGKKFVARGFVPWVHNAFALRKRGDFLARKALRAPVMNSAGLQLPQNKNWPAVMGVVADDCQHGRARHLPSQHGRARLLPSRYTHGSAGASPSRNRTPRRIPEIRDWTRGRAAFPGDLSRGRMTVMSGCRFQ